jgi:hypothetical protein
MKKNLLVLGVVFCSVVMLMGSAIITPSATALPLPEATPTLRPLAGDDAVTDPTAQMDEYMGEGLFISHFDSDDFDSWIDYLQDTEIAVTSGDPPEGYINVSGWHPGYDDKWVLPTDGFQLTDTTLIAGDGAGHWMDTVSSSRVVIADIPHDWSGYMFLSFWAYSAEANNAGIEIAIYSESEAYNDDYYKREIIVDWEGWRLFEIPLHEFSVVREPEGWQKIDYIKIASSGWGHEPVETTDLIFDEMKLSNVRIGPRMSIDLPADMAHPYLMLNAAEIEEIRAKVEQYEWAAVAYATLQARADNWVNRPISVPETGGGFYHDDDAAAYAITEAHYELADRARDLALMYQFTGDEAYAAAAKEILLAYADVYLTYEIHDKEGRTGDQAGAGGRATAQGINEARWIIPLTWAYDLIFDQLSEAEDAAIIEQLLRPTADLLMLNNEGRHNHQAWYNSGVGVIGFALGDTEYIWYALLKDDSSLNYQLSASVTADGMWYEGSMHYQFYVLRALQPLMEVTHHAGFNVYENPQYKALFDFMITYADPGYEMPTINDGRVVNLTDSDRATYYELAYRRLGDPHYVPVLMQSDRTDLNALLYGVPELSSGVSPGWQTQNYDSSDLVVLRSNEGEDSIQATVNYMGYQGGHSHPDQLSIVLYGLGMPLAPDAGSIKYRLLEQEGWFKQTIAHNGLVVDGASQERASAGQLTQLVASDAVQMATVFSDGVYPGVDLERTVLLNDTYLIDMYSASSRSSHTYDWVYHNMGEFSTADADFQSVDTPPDDTNGYEYLTNVASAGFDGSWQAEWAVASNKYVGIHVLGAPGTTYYTAEGPIAARVGDEIADDPVSLLIARREAEAAQFVSIIQPYQDQDDRITITDVPVMGEDGQLIEPASIQAMQIEHAAGSDLLIIDDEAGIKQLAGLEMNAEWSWLSLSDDGMLAWALLSGDSLIGDGWSVTQEDLSADGFLDGMGLFLEVTESGNLHVKSLYEYQSYVVLEGFMDFASEIVELDQNGDVRRTMPTRTNEDGVVKFLAHPGYMYEVISG